MSGLEALSLACSIFQTIAFARDLVIVCRDIYNGQKTPESHLQQKATAVSQAAQQIKDSQSLLSTPEGKALADVAQNCEATAMELQKVVDNILKMHKKGAVISAVSAHIKALWEKSKIEDLDKALSGYMNTMQLLLINRICNQQTAHELTNRSDFQHLDQTLQSFIRQIASGYTKLEDLLKSEGVATRTHITDEGRRAEESMKAYLAEKIRAQKDADASEKQRERLLRSLKFPEMNFRRNAITEPRDAIFGRIFRSYERAAALETDGSDSLQDLSSNVRCINSGDLFGVDEAWRSFVDWLRSEDSLFWIQGKPGSGKSTLMKHIIAHEATQNLLNEWSQTTRIVSHYFYIIGPTQLQKNLNGFYCSLAHQILGDDQHSTEPALLIDKVIHQLPFIASKEHHSDWSLPELEILLEKALAVHIDTGSLCIFVDGLDEYVGAEGQDGLLDTLQVISEHPKVKICVSSRPEPQLRNRLAQQHNLKLHDLTWPDMEAYVGARLGQFRKQGLVSDEVWSRLTRELLGKAQGVFLWLRLAIQSLKNGLQHGNTEELLMARLQELPSELEELYEAMWRRLNEDTAVYRESAAKCLQIAVAATKEELVIDLIYFENQHHWVSLERISLFEMTFTNRSGMERKFLDPNAEVDFEEASAMVDKNESEISVRCAGLLEVNPAIIGYLGDFDGPETQKLVSMMRRVDFVHRTAYDFLDTTIAGNQILGHSKTSSAEVRFGLWKAHLCFTRLICQECSHSCQLSDLLGRLHMLWMTEAEMQSTKDMSEILDIIRCFHERDFLGVESRSPKAHFLSVLGMFPGFDAFALPQFDGIGAISATTILREVWLEHHLLRTPEKSYQGPSIEVVQALLHEGADPSTVATYVKGFKTLKTSALLACCQRLSQLVDINEEFHCYSVAEALRAMVEACPALTDHRWLVGPPRFKDVKGSFVATDRPPKSLDSTGVAYHPVFEISTSCLLQFVHHIACWVWHIIPFAPRLQELQDGLCSDQPRLRYICIDGGKHWFQVVNQQPFELFLSPLFNLLKAGDIGDGFYNLKKKPIFLGWHELVRSFEENSRILKRMELKDILKQAWYDDGEAGSYPTSIWSTDHSESEWHDRDRADE